MFFCILITICLTTVLLHYNYTMVSVAKRWLICDYHGLTIVTMVLFLFFCSKTMVSFHKGYDRHVDMFASGLHS